MDAFFHITQHVAAIIIFYILLFNYYATKSHSQFCLHHTSKQINTFGLKYRPLGPKLYLSQGLVSVPCLQCLTRELRIVNDYGCALVIGVTQ